MRVWQALDQAHLGEFVRELPQGLDTVVGERGVRFSDGQRLGSDLHGALYTPQAFSHSMRPRVPDPRYTDPFTGRVLVDRVCRYESLDEELAKLSPA